MGMQRLLETVYPPRCLACGDLTAQGPALCGPCWRDAPFISGVACCLCGAPLPGEDDPGADPGPGSGEPCDDCRRMARPWTGGRAVFLYRGTARRMVLGLKHSDRGDLAGPAGRWLAAAVRGLGPPDMLVVPVPAHWLRLLRRRYNQAALLSGALAGELGLQHLPDGLRRVRRTPALEEMGRDQRHALLKGAIAAHPRRGARLRGRTVLLVDDVMTSGATLAAAATACLDAGAERVFVSVLARAARDA